MSRALLEVVGDISRYQAEMAKIPGVTDAQAARSALAWERRMHAAQVKAAKDAEKQAKKSAEFWEEVGKIAGGVTVGSIASAGIQKAADLAYQLAAGLVTAGRDALAAQDQVGDFAEDVGLAADRMAALRMAAIAGGEVFDTFEGTLSGFVVSVKKAQDGVAKQAKLFDLYGIAVHDADGKSRDVNAVLDDTIRKLSEIEDPGERAGAAMRLLGSEGGKLLRVLGGRELADWSASLRQAGIDLDALAANADAFDAATNRLNTELDLAGQRMAAAFGDEAASLINSLTTGIVGFGVVAEKVADELDSAFSLQGMVNLLELTNLLADPIGYAMGRYAKNKLGLDRNTTSYVDSFLGDVVAETKRRMAAIDAIAAGGGSGARAAATSPNAVRSPTGPQSSNRAEDLFGTIDVTKFEEAAAALDEAAATIYAPEAASEIGKITERWDDLELSIMQAAQALEEYDRADDLLKALAVRRADELAAANERAAKATADATRQAERETSAAAANAVESYARIFDGLVAQAFDMARELVGSSKRSAIEQFEVNKKLALAEIGINTSRAAMSAYASASNYIQGIVQAALVTAAGVAQAAIVGSKRITLHSGGAVTSVPRMADEVDTRLKRGEHVVSSPVVAANGGHGGIERKLRGSGNTVLRLDFGRGRVIDMLAEAVEELVDSRRLGTPRTVAAGGW